LVKQLKVIGTDKLILLQLLLKQVIQAVPQNFAITIQTLTTEQGFIPIGIYQVLANLILYGTIYIRFKKPSTLTEMQPQLQ
jgi:hypothetical protein